MMAVFFFIAHEKGITFHTQPQTGASPCCLQSTNGEPFAQTSNTHPPTVGKKSSTVIASNTTLIIVALFVLCYLPGGVLR